MSDAERARRYRARRRLAAPALPAGQSRVRITQLDGKLPNLALMKLAAFHRARGDATTFTRSPYRSPVEPPYDRVYGSAIFSFTAGHAARFKQEFPDAIVGGTWDITNPVTVEDVIGDFDGLDYSLWPDFTASLRLPAQMRLLCRAKERRAATQC
jgi:hypothetical protein